MSAQKYFDGTSCQDFIVYRIVALDNLDKI